jgi:hypothetical protein
VIDEDAFGLLVSYHRIEDDEYAGERADFVERYRAFASLVHAELAASPPGAAARALDFGHAVYVELCEDEEHADLIAWLKKLRAKLGESGYETAGVLTYGSRWREESEEDAAASPAREDDAQGVEVPGAASVKLVRVSLPSEPLRRALLAEAATHGDQDAGTDGWGPGLYLGVDAVEALGRKPKNAPTVLRTGGAEFFRAGS